MSTHPRRQRRSLQLRLLAPKGEIPVQYRLHNNIQDQQPTEGPDLANDVNLQQPATSQPCVPLTAVSSGHDFTSSSTRQPNSTFSIFERTQHPVVAPWTNIYSNASPSTSAYGGFPELAHGNEVPGVDAHENIGLLTQHLLYGDVQLQETFQNRQRQDYWIPTLHALEDAVWANMAQPTIGAHQDLLSQPTIDQYPHPQLPPIQPAYYAPLQQNSQHMTCINCLSIWRFHLECIMFSDVEDKGMSGLKRSYRDLQQHIHEAHRWESGVACAACETLFCYHLDKVMILEVAKGDLCEVKIDLRSSCAALRDHIKEAHGGC